MVLLISNKLYSLKNSITTKIRLKSEPLIKKLILILMEQLIKELKLPTYSIATLILTKQQDELSSIRIEKLFLIA